MATTPLSPPRPSRTASHPVHSAAYARLKEQVTDAGLLNRSLSFYLPLIIASFTAYALSIWAIFAADAFIWLTLACAAFILSTVQIAGLMHDAGHRAVFRSSRLNSLLGLATTSAIGMVFPSWVERHNLHHANPNRVDIDPDMEVPFLVFSPEAFAGKDAFQRFFARWQAYYYYPLGALVSFSNRLGSLTYFARHRTRTNLARLALYLPAIVALFPGPFLVFELEKALFVFLFVHLSTGVYLASCFAPNHKGMPAVAGDTDVSFLEQQVRTSRNVKGGLLTDFFLVGLNHQIEHHLFPACPRNKLRLLGPYVLKTCEEQALPYAQVSFLRTNRIIVGHLHGVSRPRPAEIALT